MKRLGESAQISLFFDNPSDGDSPPKRKKPTTLDMMRGATKRPRMTVPQVLKAIGITWSDEEAKSILESVFGAFSDKSPLPQGAMPSAALLNVPEPTKKKERTVANLKAMKILASKKPQEMTAQDRIDLASYSGWGGLSIKENAENFPSGVPVPASMGLIHEYYTPLEVTKEIAKAFVPFLSSLPREGQDGKILTLEPSAGIGRFLHATAIAGIDSELEWKVVEYSPLSAKMLAAMRPDVDLFEGSFQSWINQNEAELSGKFGLILANPPYGTVGASVSQDRVREYREKRAYLYFLRRSLDLLAPNGMAAFLIPSGFLSGVSAEMRGAREKILRKHHIVSAFRLPSDLFAGALLVIDLIFFRARPVALVEPPASDDFILSGEYFKKYPSHILGKEINRVSEDDQDATRKPRWGYQVVGKFEGLPKIEARSMGEGKEDAGAAKKKKTKQKAFVGLGRKMGEMASAGGNVGLASALGIRVDRYMALLATNNVEKAFSLWKELHSDLMQYVANFGNPRKDQVILSASSADSAIARFIQAFNKEGGLVEGIANQPDWNPEIKGDKSNIENLASATYYRYSSSEEILRLADLVNTWSRENQVSRDVATREVYKRLKDLYAAGWCIHPEDAASDKKSEYLPSRQLLFPKEHYLTGYLWPRHDALLAVKESDIPYPFASKEQLERQYNEILKAINPAVFEDLNVVSPRHGWIPNHILTAWVVDLLQKKRSLEVPEGFEIFREDGMYLAKFPDITYVDPETSQNKTTDFYSFFLNPKTSSLFFTSGAEEDKFDIRKKANKFEEDRKSKKTLILEAEEATKQKGKDNLDGLILELLESREKDAHPKTKIEVLSAARILPAYWRYADAFDIIGWLNHDLTLWTVKGDEIKDQREMDKKRVEQSKIFDQTFLDFMESNPDLKDDLMAAYNRKFRGDILRSYSNENLKIARWSDSAPPLRDVQNAGARRILDNRKGLLAFDVGVGKTFTGIAVVAKAKQEGWVRRPVFLVPNSIVWNWKQEISRVLPDYRVAVIGSKLIQSGSEVSSTNDTPQERADKWTGFQLGQYDAVILSYTALSRTQINEDNVRRYVERVASIRKAILLSKRNQTKRQQAQVKKLTKWLSDAKLLRERIETTHSTFEREEAEEKLARIEAAVAEFEAKEKAKAGLAKDKKSRKKEDKAGLTEREEAVQKEDAAAWISQKLELPESWEYDPGIAWDDLGIDMLVVDEAQNFKNKHLPTPREGGGVPKFIGSPGEGSNRAWQLDFRAAQIREKTGGTGIVLLSATPAKNSPLEFYSLLDLVDPDIWTNTGIYDSDQFISRYLKLDQIDTVNSKMELSQKLACTGFQNLDELRTSIFRYGDFKTAEDANISLPEPKNNFIRVKMNAAQDRAYESILDEILSILGGVRKRLVNGKIEEEDVKVDRERMGEVIGLLQRLSITALHHAYATVEGSVLDDEDEDKGKKGKDEDEDSDSDKKAPKKKKGLKWGNAHTFTDYRAPKLIECAKRIAELKEIDGKVCGHIIFCEPTAVHYWMMQCLIDKGIPKERIAILNAEVAKSTYTRQQIALDFRGDDKGNARYDVVIANQIAYEGVNLQDRTCAIHHLDLPWEPATLQQRNGRGVRQGNKFEAIQINYYFSDNSADGMRYEHIKGKHNWMVSLIKSQDRIISNPAAQSDMTALEILKMISRDPEETERIFKAQQEEAKRRRRDKAAEKASTILKAANALFTKARSSRNAEESARLREQGEYQLSSLKTIPKEDWPFFDLAAKVRTQQVFSAGGFPLYEGMIIRLNNKKGESYFLEIGSFGSRKFTQGLDAEFKYAIGFRSSESPKKWKNGLTTMFDALKLDRLIPDDYHIVPPNTPLAELPPWEELGISYYNLGMDGLSELQWTGASDSFLTRAWDKYKASFLAEVSKQARPNGSIYVPMMVDGRLFFSRGGRTVFDGEVFPPNREGRARFVAAFTKELLAHPEMESFFTSEKKEAKSEKQRLKKLLDQEDSTRQGFVRGMIAQDFEKNAELKAFDFAADKLKRQKKKPTNEQSNLSIFLHDAAKSYIAWWGEDSIRTLRAEYLKQWLNQQREME